MPDKSQLEKFSSDMQSVGDEVNVRRARGQRMPTLKYAQKNNDAAPDDSTNNDTLDSLGDIDSIDSSEGLDMGDLDLPDLSDFDSPVDSADDAATSDSSDSSPSDSATVDGEGDKETTTDNGADSESATDDVSGATDIDIDTSNNGAGTDAAPIASDSDSTDTSGEAIGDNLQSDDNDGGEDASESPTDSDLAVEAASGGAMGGASDTSDDEFDIPGLDDLGDVSTATDGETGVPDSNSSDANGGAGDGSDSGAGGFDDFELPNIDDDSGAGDLGTNDSDSGQDDLSDLSDNNQAASDTLDDLDDVGDGAQNASDLGDLGSDIGEVEGDSSASTSATDATLENNNDSPANSKPISAPPPVDKSGGVDASDFGSLNSEDIPDAGINIPKPIGEGEDYSSAEIPDLGDDDEDEESDFDIPDTTNTTSDSDEFSDPTAVSSHDSGFELEDKGKVKPEVGDFEIPGVNAPEIGPDAEAFTDKVRNIMSSNKDLPPNTLSDADYDKFKKNFVAYPLNIRLAIEDLFLKDEFTDDTEFDIVQKVVMATPARKIASTLEKMLDISLPVPKDFEKRSSEEYDAYKSSFEYQLRNRIIPGAIMCAGAAIICILLFLAGKNFIYKPLKANSLYSKGYNCITESDYKTSEVYFKEAITYALQKGWFFKYARGYREHKQYLRAEKMYDNILKVFNNDKAAGLEWADMETRDLSDYEKAEQIILRRVLDFHVNDKDALLALADNYLEWATEKEPKYFDTAFSQYLNLLELYGKKAEAQDLYLGRLLRYFIRTDNLQKVLETKARFMDKKKEKSLSGSDWTELGGFLIDKLYGRLEPNDEYLREKIEDVKETLFRALRADDNNPVALYNMGRYYIQMHDDAKAAVFLDKAIENFSNAASIKKADMYRYINSYKLSGDLYTDDKEYLKAEESYTKGIALFTREASDSGLKGNQDIGKLFYNMADINYFIAGNLDSALLNYQDAIKYGYDNVLARYKIGSMLYNKQDLQGALDSFRATLNMAPSDENVLLALGNTLALRGDNYLAQGYYEQLLSTLDEEKSQMPIVTSSTDDGVAILDMYVKAHNNLGVILHRLAKASGNSSLNAKAIVNLQEGLRAYDSLTRNQKSMVRLAGSNLSEQNIKYITAPHSEFSPELYTDISRKMASDRGLAQ